MVMVGVITVLVLLQKAPTWSVERRLVAVAVMGAVGATMAYATAISLDVLPNKPVLLVTAFFLSVIIGALLVGLAPFLKQHFLPVVMTYILILGVPSAGATMMPDLLPTGLRYLSDVLPLAQAVKIIRSETYFDGTDTLAPTLILLVWAAIALLAVGVARDRQASRRTILSQDPVAAVPLVPS
jgi:ABC-type multidrug transport system permease subunit